jgi:hypothetical protein
VRRRQGSTISILDRVISRWLGPLTDAISDELARVLADQPGIDRRNYGPLLKQFFVRSRGQAVDDSVRGVVARDLAAITIHSVMNSCLSRSSTSVDDQAIFHVVATQLGAAIHSQLAWHHLVVQYGQGSAPLELLKRISAPRPVVSVRDVETLVRKHPSVLGQLYAGSWKRCTRCRAELRSPHRHELDAPGHVVG